MVQMAEKWHYLDDLQNISEKEGKKLLRRLGQSWPFMPFFSSPKKLAIPRMMAKISWDFPPDFVIFFLGSFNPWHRGHRFCVELCLKTLPDAHLMVVPDHSPWKKNVLRENLWQNFLNLCREVYDLPCSIYPGLWGTKRENYTVDWLPLVQIEKKGLLMGGDNFLHLLKWKQADRLLLCLKTILVICRSKDFSLILQMKRQLKRKYPHLTIMTFKNNPCADLSSSGLRDC